MPNLRTLPTIFVALALALPMANAAWSMYGEMEPNYPGDVTEKFMFVDPPLADLPVYFNAVLTDSFLLGVSSPNPTVGLLESRYYTPGDFMSPYAYLGIWRDCNQDGYVGQAESALSEYPTLVLEEQETQFDLDNVCPDGSVFNRNGWVYEFIWIYDGAERNSTVQLPRFVNDTTVKVWGDSVLPGAHVTPDCFINPPIGFFSSTGAMIDFVDCNTGRAIVAGINTVDGELDTGIGFYNEGAPDNPQCSESPLNRNETHIFADAPECPEKSGTGLWEEDSGDAAFTTWDCAKPETHNTTIDRPVEEPIVITNPASGAEVARAFNNSEITLLAVPGVSSSAGVRNARGSYYDGANATLDSCEDSGAGFNNNPEAEVEQAHDKVVNDYTMTFYPGQQSRHTWEGQVCNSNLRVASGDGNETLPGVVNPVPPNPLVTNETESYQMSYCTDTAQTDQPRYLGANKFGAIYQTAYFTSIATLPCCPPPNFATVRDGELVAGVPVYWTFYAQIGAATTGFGGTTPGGVGIYGKEWCEGATSGVVRGFDCDPTHWYNPKFGGTEMPKDPQGNARGAVPGEGYQLRDIDCYDGAIASRIAPGIGFGTTPLGPDGSCANFG